MKKALAIFVTVCIIASLFVSCDNTTKLDELVSTRFDAAGSRSLSVSNENFIDFNDSSIKWQYKAAKDSNSDPSYNVGAAAEWTDIPGTPSGRLSNTIEFSQGKWNFELRAVKVNNTNVVVYYGRTEEPVLLVKQDSVRPISINLTAQFDGQMGYIVLDQIKVQHMYDGTVAYDAPSKVIIDDAIELVLDTDYVISTNGDSISSKTGTGYQISVGTHTVKVQKIGANDEILAEEEKTIEVYASLKTTISNWIVEITQAGKFDPFVEGAKSGDVEDADDDGNLALTVENVTPSMVSGNSTTVTVPTSVLNGGTTATVSVAVKKASEISSDNSFEVTQGNDVAASISLTLKSGETAITDFGSNKVTVETYIETGLSGVTVKYNGNGTTGNPDSADTTYDPVTGKLTFKTTHFSEFYVEALKQAQIEDKVYLNLQRAIDDAETNNTILLLADVVTPDTSYYVANKNLTLDLNGKTLSGSGNDGTLCVGSDATLTINGEGNVIGNDDQNYGMAIWAKGSNSKVIINGGSYSNTLTHTDDQMDMIYASKGGKVVINGGVFECITPKWTLNVRDADYASGASSITVYGGTFHGFNPANCESEGIGTSFIEDWYISENIGSEAEAIYKVGPAEEVTISSNQELSDALANTSDTIIIHLPEGEFTLPDGYCQGKKVKMVGSGYGTKLSILNKDNKDEIAYPNNASLLFESMTIQGQEEGNYGGLAHTKKVTYNNCKIRGKITLYAGVEEFNNCTFENKNDYAIWTWGGKKVTLTGCTFNSGGKAVLLYGGAGSSESPTTVLTVTDCVFNDDDTLNTDKAAIEIGNDYGATYILNVTNPTVYGFAAGLNTGSKVWANKNSMDAEHLTVTIDGTQVH